MPAKNKPIYAKDGSMVHDGSPILIRVRGRIYSLTSKALKSYIREYGLSLNGDFSFEDCLNHIASLLEEALASEEKIVEKIYHTYRDYETRGVRVRLIGSKIENMKLKLTNPLEEKCRRRGGIRTLERRQRLQEIAEEGEMSAFLSSRINKLGR